MEEEQELQLEIEEEDTSEEGILLFSNRPGPRIFTFMGEDSGAVAGIVLEETEDSFLVGLPARVVMPAPPTNKHEAVPLVEVPYVRILKSSVKLMMYAYGIIEATYMEYVRTKGSEIFPDIGSYLEVDADDLEASSIDMDSAVVGTDNVGMEQEATGDNKVLGMSDEELRIHLEKKFKSGELLSVNRKKQ